MPQDSPTPTPTPTPTPPSSSTAIIPPATQDSMANSSDSKPSEQEQATNVDFNKEAEEPPLLQNDTTERERIPHQPKEETLETEPPLLKVSEPEQTPPANSEANLPLLPLIPDSETPNQPEEMKPEPEDPERLILEKRKQYMMEVTDWTEPEPPDAALLEAAAAAAASEPKPEEHTTTNTHKENPEVTTPATPGGSRSLAEMMDKEEAEEKPLHNESPKIQIPRSLGSFKEETNKLSDLSELERTALHELQQLIQESKISSTDEDSSKTSIYGVPLFNNDKTDVVLLKFLRARDFKVEESYSMLKKTLQWRNDFNIEELLDENLGEDLDKVVFMQGHDKENHPVCYNVYGEFQNKDLYQRTFSDEEKRDRFLRWRIQFLEKSIRKLDFVAGGVSKICQVNDLKNSPGPSKTELRLATKQAVQLLQDNYPEFVSKQIFINVPWWYLAFYKIISPFMTQRSKSKLVFASSSRSTETLFKYISPEQVPVQYGGLSVDYCDCNSDFTNEDIATEITIKPTTKQTVEIIIYEKCTIVWEIRVVGWEVSYGAEYVPENTESYTVIIQKPRKMSVNNVDEPVISQSFKVGEEGKILLTIDNPTSNKKKLIYRFKVKPLSSE